MGPQAAAPRLGIAHHDLCAGPPNPDLGQPRTPPRHARQPQAATPARPDAVQVRLAGAPPGRPDRVGGALIFADAGPFLPRPLHAHRRVEPSFPRSEQRESSGPRPRVLPGGLQSCNHPSPPAEYWDKPATPRAAPRSPPRESGAEISQRDPGREGTGRVARSKELGVARRRGRLPAGRRALTVQGQEVPARVHPRRAARGGGDRRNCGRAGRVGRPCPAPGPPSASHPAWPARGTPSGRGPPGLGTRLARNSYLLLLPRLPPPAGPRPAITRGRPVPPRPRASGRVWGKARKNVASP